MPPGPELAAVLAGLDHRAVPNDEVVTVLEAHSRQLAHEQARTFSAMNEVLHRLPTYVPGAILRGSGPAPYAADEVRAALAWSRRFADRETDLAFALVVGLPQVQQALLDGRIDRGKATAFADHLIDLSEEQAEAICRQVVPAAPDLTPWQIADRIKKLILQLDPAYYERRYRKAPRDQKVVAYLDADGAAVITGSGLPAEDAAARPCSGSTRWPAPPAEPDTRTRSTRSASPCSWACSTGSPAIRSSPPCWPAALPPERRRRIRATVSSWSRARATSSPPPQPGPPTARPPSPTAPCPRPPDRAVPDRTVLSRTAPGRMRAQQSPRRHAAAGDRGAGGPDHPARPRTLTKHIGFNHDTHESREAEMLVIAESRRSHRVGVELAVASLLASCPGIKVHLHCGWADDSFSAWCERIGVAQVHKQAIDLTGGWNIKPDVLLYHLANGATSVTWMDSDIIVAHDWRHLINADAPEVFVATEETAWGQYQGGIHRTRAWNLAVGRSLPTTVNTGFIQVTAEHTELLSAWRLKLADTRYLEAQKLPWYQRPLHLLGDQEVLTAILGAADFAHLPLHLLRQGVDIAQCYGPAGYQPGARIRAAVSPQGVPPLVHAMGRKPWEETVPSPNITKRARQWYDTLHARLSPYTVVAAQYQHALSSDAYWLPTPVFGQRGRVEASLRELPLAVIDNTIRMFRQKLQVGRYDVEGLADS